MRSPVQVTVLGSGDAFGSGGRLNSAYLVESAAATFMVDCGMTVLQGLPASSLDLVFLDPPFDADLFGKALAAAWPALAPEGLIYLEAPRLFDEAALAPHELTMLRHMKAGAVHGHLLRRTA